MVRAFKNKKWSLKQRMRALLVVSSLLPLLIVWIFTNTWVLSLYKDNTELTIRSELGQIGESMELLMTSMTYMSQQIVADSVFMTNLREANSRNDQVRTNALIYLNRRVSEYEGANPNISNLVFFRRNEDENDMINTALVPNLSIDEELLFSTQHLLRFYGPHPTQSIVSDYPAISLIRKMPVPGIDNLYLYMESGYRKLGTFSAVTLDSIRAVYAVVSDQNTVVFSSDEQSIPVHMAVENDREDLIIRDKRYILHQRVNDRGWRLCVFVPMEGYYAYTLRMALSFAAILLTAVALNILAGGFLWRSVNRSFGLFSQNLHSIMLDSAQMDIQTIYVEEFDQNFAYFAELKQRIIALLQEVKLKEQQKATLETRQLLYKINPHFIHNTLNTLKWYASDKGYSDIEEFLAAFNRLMMYNMEKDKRTTLSSELDSMQDYIALQKLKYSIDYTAHINIPQAMLQTQTPRFMLYPLVENAIMHGLEGNGHIGLSVNLDKDGRISIRIKDTGSPMEREMIEQILSDIREPDGGGLGLRYVYQILKSQFGDESAFHIHASPGGNVFEIVIPYSVGDYYAKSADH